MQNITIYTNALNTSKSFCNCNRYTKLTILLHAHFNTFEDSRTCLQMSLLLHIIDHQIVGTNSL